MSGPEAHPAGQMVALCCMKDWEAVASEDLGIVALSRAHAALFVSQSGMVDSRVALAVPCIKTPTGFGDSCRRVRCRGLSDAIALSRLFRDGHRGRFLL